MRDYSKVSPALWESERFHNLPSDDARYLLLYLLTNPHQNSAGCFRLPEGYACADLVGWDTGKFREVLAHLIAAEMVLTDEATKEILILRWFKHNAPMNPKHFAGTRRLISNIRSQTLREAADKSLTEAWEGSSSRPPYAVTAGSPNPGAVSPLLKTPAMQSVRR